MQQVQLKSLLRVQSFRLSADGLGFLFQGQWKNKFDKDNVYVSDFRVSDSRTCQVNMMYQETKFRYRYFPDDHVQLLEMPYRGDDITMVIILPTQGTALSKVTLRQFMTLNLHCITPHL